LLVWIRVKSKESSGTLKIEDDDDNFVHALRRILAPYRAYILSTVRIAKERDVVNFGYADVFVFAKSCSSGSALNLKNQVGNSRSKMTMTIL
jgi:hypothetical protein